MIFGNRNYGLRACCDRCGRELVIHRTDNVVVDPRDGRCRTEWLCAECRDKDERKARG